MSLISDLFNKKPNPNDVGIEIEVEARYTLPQIATSIWSSHADGSLRGNSMEYVSTPIPIGEVDGAVKFIKDAIKASEPRNSVRAGVHVHVNCLALTEQQLINYVALYTIFEVPLVNYCGDSRIGNAFCLRFCDAEAAIDTVRSFINRGVGNTVLDDNLRYGALNPVSLRKYGTLEFRSLGTVYPFTNIPPWAKILVQLRDFSLNYKTLQDILADIEAVGLEVFAKKVFGEHYKMFFPHFIEHELLVGLSYVRELIYFSKG